MSHFRSRWMLVLYLFILYFFYRILFPSRYSTTLILGREQQLFIRLFKSNDSSRSHIRPFRILSGSLNYFRLVPQAWPERLAQMKAAGMNTVETYVPWNIHEPEQGKYQFDDLLKFLELIHRQEMFAIIRPSGKTREVT
jgi:beta-galactosidase GanA